LFNRGCVVLQQLSEQVRDCHRRAADAKAQAGAIADPALKRSYLDLEDRWLFLARSHAFTESLQDFADQQPHLNERVPVDPKLPVVGQLFDLLPVAIYVCDADGLIIHYNNHAAKLWGRSPKLNDPTDRFCGSYRMYHLDGGPIAHPDCPMGEVLRSGVSVHDREIVVERSDGSRGVVLVNIDAIKDGGGNILGAVNCFQDTTERKRSERQIATLAVEAEHRVKNILAIVQAAVSLSHSDTPDGLKQAIEGRIKALAKVHSLFIQSRWAGAELSSIAKQELAPYLREDAARVQIDGPTLLLEPKTAQAIAVAFHELATNAAKYGALSNGEGRVEVAWACATDGRLNLCWIERGGPPVTTPMRKGFGTNIVGRIIREQSKGEMRIDWKPAGLECEIILPTTSDLNSSPK
jgi:two-component sensor histidine kinase/PAS domain-containing protein